jgi:hypothetical protein
VDTTDSSSFLFDTGVSQAAFNGSGTYSLNFTTDANYKAFTAAEGANDVLDYSVISATRTTATPNVGTIFFTSNAAPPTVPGFAISQAQVNIGGFINQANLASSSTSNSAYITAASGNSWGSAQYEAAVSGNLNIPFTQAGTGESALVGSPLSFYSESSSKLTSQLSQATLTTFAGQWNFVQGILTYMVSGSGGNPGGGGNPPPVPLPTPVLLLLSGLGLMGAVARRKAKAVR